MSNRHIAAWLLVFVAAGVAVSVIANQIFRGDIPVRQDMKQSIRVASGSMVPTFLGSHFVVNCSDCGFVFPCDAERISSSIVCANCGARQDFPSADPVVGDLVQIDHTAYERELPKRWDTIAFRQPPDEKTWAVKRVTGLPGEQVAIRHGDLYVNDQIQTKPIQVAMTMGVLVHDSKNPATTASRRWRSASENSNWQSLQRTFKIESNNGLREPDLLQYHNWRCVDSPLPREEDVPIRDSYPYNHSLSRTLSDVRDFYLLADLETNNSTQLIVVLNNNFDSFEFAIDTNRATIAISHHGKKIVQQQSDLLVDGQFALALGHVDQRVFVLVNGVTLVDQAVEQAVNPSPASSVETGPCQIGLQRGEVTLHRLRVYRDVHYRGPLGLTDTWQRRDPIDDDAFFVLGDNSPISRDSRDSTYGLIPRDNILGETVMGRTGVPGKTSSN